MKRPTRAVERTETENSAVLARSPSKAFSSNRRRQMKARAVETGLSWFTLFMLAIYVPIETWSSRDGLPNPFYLVDLIAMVLLFAGSLTSLRARPNSAPAVICAAYGWTAANAWRATFGRIAELERGGQLVYGTSELWAVGVGCAIALIGFAVSLYLVVKTPPVAANSEPNKAVRAPSEDARA